MNNSVPLLWDYLSSIRDKITIYYFYLSNNSAFSFIKKRNNLLAIVSPFVIYLILIGRSKATSSSSIADN